MCLGSGGRPALEVTNAKAQERMVTFQKPGGYVIKLAAVNGLEHDQKTEIVNVLEPPEGTITALLTISDSGINVEKPIAMVLFQPPFFQSIATRFSLSKGN